MSGCLSDYCDRPVTVARGYCHACYQRGRRHGFPPPPPLKGNGGWPRDLLLSEWHLLRDRGYTVREAAPRLGIKPESLSQAILRGRKAGHPDAVAPYDQTHWPTKCRRPAC